MNIVLGIIMIFFSVFGLVAPISALQFKDMFRIRGEREYTAFAIGMTRFGGVIGIIFGIAIMFTDIY